MSAKPILFNSEMVRAILDGRKTQTRRVIKPQPNEQSFAGMIKNGGCARFYTLHVPFNPSVTDVRNPYGRPGDTLWVRETHYLYGRFEFTGKLTPTGKKETTFVHADKPVRSSVRYSDNLPKLAKSKFDLGWHRRPSIFMPDWAARITLRVTDVRVERVQDISESGAIGEGVDVYSHGGAGLNYVVNNMTAREPVDAFELLWDSINAKRGFSWDSNPWVWVVEFEVVN